LNSANFEAFAKLYTAAYEKRLQYMDDKRSEDELVDLIKTSIAYREAFEALFSEDEEAMSRTQQLIPVQWN
jgi:hypothetical protein